MDSSRAFLSVISFSLLAAAAMFFAACSGPRSYQVREVRPYSPLPGPDQQFLGTIEGAATGAGAGAVTGAQLSAGTGPGALVGAGIGAVAGTVHGIMEDRAEADFLALQRDVEFEKERLYAQRVLKEQYERRLELHPTREIYPADIFFTADEDHLSAEGELIVSELSRINRDRAPWSRIIVVSYVKSRNKELEFAKRLAEKRAREIVYMLVRSGMEPRRLLGRGILIDAPVLLDPSDEYDRYNQAIEIIAEER